MSYQAMNILPVSRRPWLPYVAPMAVYMAFLLVQSNTNIIWLYPVKIFAVAGTLWLFRKHYTELQPGFSWLAVGIGLAAIAIWIAGDPFYPKVDELMFRSENWLSQLLHSPPPKTATLPSFDPTLIQPALGRWLHCRPGCRRSAGGAGHGGTILARIFDSLARQRGFSRRAGRRLFVAGVCDHSGALRRGTQPMAGRLDLRRTLQLAPAPDTQRHRLCHCPRCQQRRARHVGTGARRLEVLVDKL